MVKVIAIDIDGVLDIYGDFFQLSIPAWQKMGAKVGIITSRLESDKKAVAEVLEKVGLKMDFLAFMPDDFQNKQIPHGVWKAILCRVMKVDILFDDMQRDDPTFIADFVEIVKTTKVFTPVEYGSQRDANSKTAVDYAEEMIELLQGKE